MSGRGKWARSFVGRWRVSVGVFLAATLAGVFTFAQATVQQRIREWARMLHSEDPMRRTSAATSLLGTRDDDALAALLKAMGAGVRDEVRVSVITAFEVTGDDRATHQLIAALEDKSETVRMAAAGALTAIRSPKAVAAMENAAADAEFPSETRSKIITILGEMRSMESIPVLIRLLSDKDAAARKAANAALERIALRRFETVREWQAWWAASERRTRAELLEEMVTRQSALIAAMSRRMEELELALLRDRKDPKDAALLLKMLAESDSRRVKLYALEQITTAGLKGPNVAEALLKALDDPDATVRQRSVEALGALGEKSAGPRLVKVLEDPSDSVRISAALALGALGASDAVGPLCRQLTAPSEDLASAAARALGQIASPEAVTPLMDAVAGKQTSPKVQEEAATALAKIKDSRAVPALRAMVKHPNERIRWAAVDALGGLAAKEAVDDLAEAARKDPASQVRESALAALAKIGDPKALDAIVGALSDATARVAEQAFRSLLTLAEANSALYDVIVQKLIAGRQNATAEKVAAKAIEHYAAKPNNAKVVADLRERMATAWLASNEPVKARPYLEATVAADPQNAAAARKLVECLTALKERKAALVVLAQGRKNFKDDYWWAETLRIARELAAEGAHKDVVELIEGLERESAALGGEKFAKEFRDLKMAASGPLAPPKPATP